MLEKYERNGEEYELISGQRLVSSAKPAGRNMSSLEILVASECCLIETLIPPNRMYYQIVLRLKGMS